MLPMLQRKRICTAFTLVELLLGLAIAAIIGVTVYNIFWSAVRLDDRMRRVHDNYIKLLLADRFLTRGLEGAVSLDFSASYPDARSFEGHPSEFSFLTQTPKGIKRVRYYSGTSREAPAAKTMIGRVVNPLNKDHSRGLPVESLMRQESSMADWLNETSNDTSAQVVVAGIKKGSFNCQYAPFAKDFHSSGAKGIVYKDSWDDKGLPLSVSCSFILYDLQKPRAGVIFKRDIFLPPLAGPSP